MKKIICLILILTIIFGISAVACASSDDIWTLKLGVKMTEVHPESRGTRKFVELAEEKSNGRLKFDIYWGATLGSDRIQLENVSNGIQDIYIESYTAYESYVPDFAVHSIPYLFTTDEEYRRFLLSPIQQEMEDELLRKTGIRIINEEKNWTKVYRAIASRNPILSLEDINRIKIRQMPAATMTIKFWSVLGAEIVLIPWPEVYLALQQGMADTVTSAVSSLHSDKFAEIVKYAAESHEYYQQLSIAMNDKKYQSLPEELQKALNEASNEAGDYFSELMAEDNAAMQELLERDYNVEFFNFPYEEVSEKAMEFHREIEKEGLFAPGLIDDILNFLGR